METVDYNPINVVKKAFKEFKVYQHIIVLIFAALLFWLVEYRLIPFSITMSDSGDISQKLLLIRIIGFSFSLFVALYLTFFFSEFVKEIKRINRENIS